MATELNGNTINGTENLDNHFAQQDEVNNCNLVGDGLGKSDGLNENSKDLLIDCSHRDDGAQKNFLEREERLRLAKDRQAEEKQRRLRDLKEASEKAQEFRRKQEEERRKKVEDMRRREDEHRAIVEERRKRLLQEQKEKVRAVLKKNDERKAKVTERKSKKRESSYHVLHREPSSSVQNSCSGWPLLDETPCRHCLMPSSTMTRSAFAACMSKSHASCKGLHKSPTKSHTSLTKVSHIGKDQHEKVTAIEDMKSSYNDRLPTSSKDLSSQPEVDRLLTDESDDVRPLASGTTNDSERLSERSSRQVDNLHSNGGDLEGQPKSCRSEDTLSGSASPWRSVPQRRRPHSIAGRCPSYAGHTVASQMRRDRGEEIFTTSAFCCSRFRSVSPTPTEVKGRTRSTDCSRKSRIDHQQNHSFNRKPMTSSTGPIRSVVQPLPPPSSAVLATVGAPRVKSSPMRPSQLSGVVPHATTPIARRPMRTPSPKVGAASASKPIDKPTCRVTPSAQKPPALQHSSKVNNNKSLTEGGPAKPLSTSSNKNSAKDVDVPHANRDTTVRAPFKKVPSTQDSSPPVDKSVDLISDCSLDKSEPVKHVEQDEYKMKLAENRRLARELAEKKVADEKRLEEEQRMAEEQRRLKEEEEERRQEEEEMRLAAELKNFEVERLQKAMERENERRRLEEERIEVERKERLVAEQKTKEENDRREQERLEKFKRDEEDRAERKKKLELIMKRVKVEDNVSKIESSPVSSAGGTINFDQQVERPTSSAGCVTSPADSASEGSSSFRSPILQQMMGTRAKCQSPGDGIAAKAPSSVREDIAAVDPVSCSFDGEETLHPSLSGENPLPDSISADASENPLPDRFSSDACENPLPDRFSSDACENPLPDRVSSDAGENPLPDSVSSDAGENPLPGSVSCDAGENLLPDSVSCDAGENPLPDSVSSDACENPLPDTVSSDANALRSLHEYPRCEPNSEESADAVSNPTVMNELSLSEARQSDETRDPVCSSNLESGPPQNSVSDPVVSRAAGETIDVFQEVVAVSAGSVSLAAAEQHEGLEHQHPSSLSCSESAAVRHGDDKNSLTRKPSEDELCRPVVVNRNPYRANELLLNVKALGECCSSEALLVHRNEAVEVFGLPDKQASSDLEIISPGEMQARISAYPPFSPDKSTELRNSKREISDNQVRNVEEVELFANLDDDHEALVEDSNAIIDQSHVELLIRMCGSEGDEVHNELCSDRSLSSSEVKENSTDSYLYSSHAHPSEQVDIFSAVVESIDPLPKVGSPDVNASIAVSCQSNVPLTEEKPISSLPISSSVVNAVSRQSNVPLPEEKPISSLPISSGVDQTSLVMEKTFPDFSLEQSKSVDDVIFGVDSSFAVVPSSKEPDTGKCSESSTVIDPYLIDWSAGNNETNRNQVNWCADGNGTGENVDGKNRADWCPYGYGKGSDVDCNEPVKNQAECIADGSETGNNLANWYPSGFGTGADGNDNGKEQAHWSADGKETADNQGNLSADGKGVDKHIIKYGENQAGWSADSTGKGADVNENGKCQTEWSADGNDQTAPVMKSHALFEDFDFLNRTSSDHVQLAMPSHLSLDPVGSYGEASSETNPIEIGTIPVVSCVSTWPPQFDTTFSNDFPLTSAPDTTNPFYKACDPSHSETGDLLSYDGDIVVSHHRFGVESDQITSFPSEDIPADPVSSFPLENFMADQVASFPFEDNPADMAASFPFEDILADPVTSLENEVPEVEQVPLLSGSHSMEDRDGMFKTHIAWMESEVDEDKDFDTAELHPTIPLSESSSGGMDCDIIDTMDQASLPDPSPVEHCGEYLLDEHHAKPQFSTSGNTRFRGDPVARMANELTDLSHIPDVVPVVAFEDGGRVQHTSSAEML